MALDPLALLGSIAGKANQTKQTTSVTTSQATAISLTNVIGSGSGGTPTASTQTTQVPNTDLPTPVDLPILGASPLSDPSGAIDNLYGAVPTQQKIWIGVISVALIVTIFAVLMGRRGK